LVELAGFSLLMALALAAAALWSGVRDTGPGEGARPFDVIRSKVRTPAPAFELPDLAGRPVRLEASHGRVVLLNFWATWCTPCLAEMPALESLARELRDRGLDVLAVNHEEAPDAVRAFLAANRLAVPVLLDPSGDVARQYRLQALPTTFVIDRGGGVVGAALGYRDWAGTGARTYLRDVLAAPRVP